MSRGRRHRTRAGIFLNIDASFHIRTLRRFTGLHPWQLLRPCLGITAQASLRQAWS